ncbi:MAG: ATP-binding protein [Dokdonella sp.]|uniref:sensor histidine kinase n=2 Tax=Dokdonella sp. TaxID=2291710 RepID=UPI0025BA0BF4|nr:ATP-binding protein [Dokdonella sp.]MBX3700963.1 ATP-binding protein [Dokdonella sp.]
MRLFSLEGKLAAALMAAIVGAAALTAALWRWLDSPLLAAGVAVVLLAVPALLAARTLAQPVAMLIRALSGSVSAFRDGDFSFSIAARRRDEVGELIAAHNELGRVLREQRQHLFQRELLLDTVVQNTPTALVLVEPGGHVIYANLAARHLLNAGKAIQGMAFDDLVAATPAPLAQALASGSDGLFSVELDGEEETFQLALRAFSLQGRPHRLIQIRRLTRELARQEVATWKKAIRIISHELNNSLGPIRSLAHSGRELAQRGDVARLSMVFDTVAERTHHLESFIQGYARFARLPSPRHEVVAWGPFLDALARQYPFVRRGELPADPGWFDRTQVEQALINLLKNAHEAGGASSAIELEVTSTGQGVRLAVADRGAGMGAAVLANALLPFYSTKRAGSGLGLALVREIAEAHGGRVQLVNRIGGGLCATLILPRSPSA